MISGMIWSLKMGGSLWRRMAVLAGSLLLLSPFLTARAGTLYVSPGGTLPSGYYRVVAHP